MPGQQKLGFHLKTVQNYINNNKSRLRKAPIEIVVPGLMYDEFCQYYDPEEAIFIFRGSILVNQEEELDYFNNFGSRQLERVRKIQETKARKKMEREEKLMLKRYENAIASTQYDQSINSPTTSSANPQANQARNQNNFQLNSNVQRTTSSASASVATNNSSLPAPTKSTNIPNQRANSGKKTSMLKDVLKRRALRCSTQTTIPNQFNFNNQQINGNINPFSTTNLNNNNQQINTQRLNQASSSFTNTVPITNQQNTTQNLQLLNQQQNQVNIQKPSTPINNTQLQQFNQQKPGTRSQTSTPMLQGNANQNACRSLHFSPQANSGELRKSNLTSPINNLLKRKLPNESNDKDNGEKKDGNQDDGAESYEEDSDNDEEMEEETNSSKSGEKNK